MTALASRGIDTVCSREVENSLLNGVYRKMSLGLIITACVGYFTAENLANILTPGTMMTLLFAEIGIVMYLALRIEKMSASAANIAFLLYSALNGITLAPLVYVYSGESIVSTFFICSSMFISMAFYGSVTKSNLSSLGSFCTMGLFGLIFAGIVNIFLQSNQLSFIMSICGIVIFTGLTAWDVNRIKSYMSNSAYESADNLSKFQILGALTLYLDFINLFIYLLRFFGSRRD